MEKEELEKRLKVIEGLLNDIKAAVFAYGSCIFFLIIFLFFVVSKH